MELYKIAESKQESLSGVMYAAAAFLIWGLSPIYWKVLHNIHALNEYILQASLGYFINPLVNVLLGMIFLKERLRPLQTVSLVLAGVSVLYLTFHYGEFPWIALSLAFAFGFYGLIRKVATVGSLVGLSVEMLFLFIPALAYLVFLDNKGTGALFRISIKIDFFLMGTAFLTALPLLLFTLGTRRLNLTTIGFLQYIAPSCMFLIGTFLYNEPLSSSQILTFVLIWTALCIYSAESVMHYRLVKNLHDPRVS
jgi:chloramphenicol-sensitive protein RarD